MDFSNLIYTEDEASSFTILIVYLIGAIVYIPIAFFFKNKTEIRRFDYIFGTLLAPLLYVSIVIFSFVILDAVSSKYVVSLTIVVSTVGLGLMMTHMHVSRARNGFGNALWSIFAIAIPIFTIVMWMKGPAKGRETPKSNIFIKIISTLGILSIIPSVAIVIDPYFTNSIISIIK